MIHPLLKSEGIFARTGDIFIWLTDDDRRIPVQMKSKVVVGSITATISGGSYWPGKTTSATIALFFLLSVW